MPRRSVDLPADLGVSFAVRSATDRGIHPARLTGNGLDRPFHGVRTRLQIAGEPDEVVRLRARAYLPLLRADDAFSHRTAALLHGAPLPFSTDTRLHIATRAPTNLVRSRGTVGHRASAGVGAVALDGLRVTDPESTWALLGDELTTEWLVAVGDYFCRVWRDERFAESSMPLATPKKLQDAVKRMRWRGIRRLREALPLIRCDSWSPRESLTRYRLVTAGLPEPALNREYRDASGGFLGCLDMSYPELKVAVEYQGRVHGEQYSRDIERVERLRAAGWIVIQVSSELFDRPEELVRRVRDALVSRGWG